MARAEEMLNGEKKTFAALSLSLSLLSRAREKVVLALDRGEMDAIVSAEKHRQSIDDIVQHTLNILYHLI